MKTKIERLNSAIDFLKGKGKIHIQKDIVNKIKANKASVSMALNGNEKYLTDNFLKRFSEAFPIINSDWLIYERGKMTNDIEDTVTSQTAHNCPECKLKDLKIEELEKELKDIRNKYIALLEDNAGKKSTSESFTGKNIAS